MRWKQTSAELRNSCAVCPTGVWYNFWKYFLKQMAKRLFEGVQVSKWIIDYNQVKPLCNTILFWNSIRSITHSTVRNLPNPWLKKLFRKCLTRYVIYVCIYCTLFIHSVSILGTLTLYFIFKYVSMQGYLLTWCVLMRFYIPLYLLFSRTLNLGHKLLWSLSSVLCQPNPETHWLLIDVLSILLFRAEKALLFVG